MCQRSTINRSYDQHRATHIRAEHSGRRAVVAVLLPASISPSSETGVCTTSGKAGRLLSTTTPVPPGPPARQAHSASTTGTDAARTRAAILTAPSLDRCRTVKFGSRSARAARPSGDDHRLATARRATTRRRHAQMPWATKARLQEHIEAVGDSASRRPLGLEDNRTRHVGPAGQIALLLPPLPRFGSDTRLHSVAELRTPGLRRRCGYTSGNRPTIKMNVPARHRYSDTDKPPARAPKAMPSGRGPECYLSEKRIRKATVQR